MSKSTFEAAMASAGFNDTTTKISKTNLKAVMNEISDGIWGGANFRVNALYIAQSQSIDNVYKFDDIAEIDASYNLNVANTFFRVLFYLKTKTNGTYPVECMIPVANIGTATSIYQGFNVDIYANIHSSTNRKYANVYVRTGSETNVKILYVLHYVH